MNPHRTIPFDLVAVAKANRTLAIQGECLSMAATPENVNTAKRHSVYAADINTLAGLTQNNAAANSDVTLLLVMSIVRRYRANAARGNENRLINAPEINKRLLNDTKKDRGKSIASASSLISVG